MNVAKTAKQLKAFRGAIAHGSYCRVLMYWTERPYMCMAAEGAVLCGKHTTVQCKARKSGFKQWISPLNMHAHCGGGREVVGSSSGCTFFPPLCGLHKQTNKQELLCDLMEFFCQTNFCLYITRNKVLIWHNFWRNPICFEIKTKSAVIWQNFSVKPNCFHNKNTYFCFDFT